jgi:uncharacterized repeat protein (TIGR02543 family)
VKTGYVFMGWFTAASGGNSVDFNSDAAAVITENKTFHAQWKQIYTVTLVNLNTMAAVAHMVLAGANITLSKPDGWGGQLEGWYTSPEFTFRQYTPNAVATVNTNITLYARFQ